MTDTLDRTPPHDADAEQATLGSVMMSPSLLPDLRAVLDPADFYRPAHEQIWAAILALADRGHPFDMIAVGNELRIRGQVDKVGGPLYLHDLVSGVAVVSNAPHYATIIREHAERRRLIERLTRLQQEALSGRDLTVLREQIQTIADDQPRTSAGTTLERYPALDLADLLNPDRPPREWVVAGLLPARASTALVAPAGTAKSLLSLGLAIHVSQGRRHFAGFDIPSRRQVLYIDMENTPDDLAERFEDYGLGPTDTLAGLHYLSLPRLPALDTPEGGHELRSILDAYQLTPGDLVILDSLQRVTEGEENKSDTLRAFYAHAGIELKRRGLTVLRLDNTGKDTTKGSRGTSSKKDDVDVELVMIRDADDPHKFHIEVTKGRLGDFASRLTITRDADAKHITWSTAADPQRASIQECKRFLDDNLFPTAGRGSGVHEAFAFTQQQGRRFVRETVRMAQKERKTPTPNTAVQVFDIAVPDASAQQSETSCAADPRHSTAQFDTAPPETQPDKGKRTNITVPNHNGTPPHGPTGAAVPSVPRPIGLAQQPEGDQKSINTSGQVPGGSRLPRTRCTICQGPMIDLGDGATTHPGCTEPEPPAHARPTRRPAQLEEDPDACPF